MKISLLWLNRYLDKPVTAVEAERALTFTGFPLESITDLGGGDWLLDVEVTSNRGDCLSHVGAAREIAAATGRRLVKPDLNEPPRQGNIGDVFALENLAVEACPLFTAQVIRGVRVGPSPAWLADALTAVGQRPINNIVDVTNWLTFELGQPAHVFDLAKLGGARLIVRWAHDGESLRTLDGKQRKLRADELVVADGERAQSLAGVIGGADSEVSDATVDIVLEAATWDPVVVRRAARRLDIRTDASHRFERYVDPRTVEYAARRAAAMIVEVAGGQLHGGADRGVVVRGRSLAPLAKVSLRIARCDALLGVKTTAAEMLARLRALEVDVTQRDEQTLVCRIPPWRPDLTREIDLVEEIARTVGLDRILMHDRVAVMVRRPQPTEQAARKVGELLAGLGFHEAVTFSFLTAPQASLFAPPGVKILELDDARRGADPVLRPSLIPSLLACRKRNQDGRVDVPGGVRLFETAAVYAESSSGQTLERRVLGLLADVQGVARGKKATIEQRQEAVRLMIGAIDALLVGVTGSPACVEPGGVASEGWDKTGVAKVRLGDREIGLVGLISASAQQACDLDALCVAAELDLDPVLERYPPMGRVMTLPAFPGIERDLSVIVDETVTWRTLETTVRSVNAQWLEQTTFVGTYRGKQVGAGKKSVTMRLFFRDPSRTLRHDEIDPKVAEVLRALESIVSATLRQ